MMRGGRMRARYWHQAKRLRYCDERQADIEGSEHYPHRKKFGVILAVQNSHHFEIAIPPDSGYSDGRRPDAIEFTSGKRMERDGILPSTVCSMIRWRTRS
jgi:hypothetical protein